MLNAEEVQEIQRLHVQMGREADSFFVGEYRSSFRGEGIEFEDVRPYVPGDEIRRIDWNVTARTGYPHVKVFREEREKNIILLVDISGSMYFGSKRKICSLIAGALAFAAMRNQDRVGLILFGDTVKTILPPKNKNGYVWQIIQTVCAYSTHAKGTNFSEMVGKVQRILPRRSIVCVLSDFLASDWQTISQLQHHHKVHGFAIHDPLETTFPFQGLLDVEDMESGQRRLVDTQTVRLGGFGRRRHEFQALGIPYQVFSKEEEVISGLLQHFKRLGTGR